MRQDGPAIMFLLFAFSLVASAADIVIVEGEYLAQRQPSEAAGVQQYVGNVARALRRLGLEYDTVKDSAVEKGEALKGRRVAIFPHNGTLPEGEVAAVEAFLDQGGKVIFFYSLGGRLASRLGIRDAGYQTQQPGEGRYATVRFAAPNILGLPAQMTQNSWNIHAFEAVGAGTQVIGTWVSREGAEMGPAVAIGPDGVVMGHVLLNNGPEASRFLIAVIGHWFPDMWARAVEGALSRSEEFGRFRTAAELREFVKGIRDSGGAHRMLAALARAEAVRYRARNLADARRWPEALDEVATIQSILEAAYAELYPPREGEMRAVWCHSPFSVADWDAACRHLRECGFNAVILNVCNAAISYYPSKYLRQHERARQEGDQIVRVAKACAANGLELHAWRVNWNPGSDQQRIEQLRADGLNAVAFNGQPGTWLCPSQPINRQHELDTMREIVANYDVAGIHFDYIRYANSNYCYCSHCRARFEDQIGHPVANWPGDVLEGELREAYLEFRRQQINVVVEQVSRETRQMKPNMKVSAAVFGEWPASRVSIGQDAKFWVEQGWLDFVCPMNYTNDTNYLRRLTEAQVRAVAGRCPLYIGIGAWRHESIATLVDQIQATRELGADGFVLFSYEAGRTSEFISLLGKGQTKGQTYPPHHAPQVSVALPNGMFEELPNTFRAGERIEATIELSVPEWQRKDGTLAHARIMLETTEGRHLGSFQPLQTRETVRRAVRLRVPEGSVRLALYGTLSARGKRIPFVSRSAPFGGLSAAAVAELRAASEPPRIEGEGLKVGVTTGGYGTTSLIQTLKREPGIIPFEVRRLTPEFLAVCDVLILAQFRSPEEVKPSQMQAVVDWVRNGGRAMLMHDAVGYRRHPVLFPEIGSGAGIGSSRGVVTTPGALGPESDSLSFEHSYYDHIRLAPGVGAMIVAREPDNEGAAPVVIAGQAGKGWVVLNGMVTGLTDDDREVVAEGGEARLLAALVRWLGERVSPP